MAAAAASAVTGASLAAAVTAKSPGAKRNLGVFENEGYPIRYTILGYPIRYTILGNIMGSPIQGNYDMEAKPKWGILGTAGDSPTAGGDEHLNLLHLSKSCLAPEVN